MKKIKNDLFWVQFGQISLLNLTEFPDTGDNLFTT